MTTEIDTTVAAHQKATKPEIACDDAASSDPPLHDKPHLRDDVVVRQIDGEEGPVYVVKDLAAHVSIRLGVAEWSLLSRFDGTTTIDSARRAARLEDRIGIDLADARWFVERLRQLNFIDDEVPVEVARQVAREVAGKNRVRVDALGIGRARSNRAPFDHESGFIARLAEFLSDPMRSFVEPSTRHRSSTRLF